MLGVLLLNLGGPDTQAAVRPFLYNLFSDRDIIRLGPSFLQEPIARLISLTRAPKTRSYYALIGGGSPIERITRQQAKALEDTLKPHGGFRVYVGMRYWHPFIGDTVDAMQRDGIQECLALSLYPHYSVATTGSAYSELQRCLERHPLNCSFAGPWYDSPLYINAVTDTVVKALSGHTKEINLLYSAHSLPQSFIDRGDPYVQHIKTTIDLVNRNLSQRGYRVKSFLSYQSRSGPVKWLEPSTEAMIEELGREGVHEIIVVPISFVSDHIETLYEIDILYRELALKHGVILKRAESLNTTPLFIEALKDIVLRSVAGKQAGSRP
ncbi:MAG: ferrochelatase [bacterium]